MTTIKVDTITNAAGTGAPNIPDGVTIAGTALASINSMDYTASASEPTSPKNGAIWWDTGNSKFFQYMNGAWVEVSYTNVPTWFGDRGLFGGGNDGGNVIQYITISSAGNATDFGDLTVGSRDGLASCSDGSRGVFAGGGSGGSSNVIDYVTIATTGNATDFGDLLTACWLLAGCSNTTYGLFGGGGTDPGINVISYITLATPGNATDFGDLSTARLGPAACADKTYGLFAGGDSGYFYGSILNSIDYVTIATPGNAADFGDLTVARGYFAACSNETYGLFGGGYDSGFSQVNTIDYVTIAAAGNATDFGDLTLARDSSASCSNGTYGVWGGGGISGATYDVIDYVTIATPGNATDFGDLLSAVGVLAACSGD